jgi:C4-dicarboxylate transporter DctQ subunit
MATNDDRALSPGARLLAKADAGYFEVEKLFNLLSAFTIFAMMMMAVVQVLGRKFFNSPVPGYVDWVEMFMAVFAFLGIAYCQKLGGHVRMELIIGRFKGRALYFLEIIGTAIAMMVIAILAWYAYTHFLRAWTIGDSSIDIQLPIWPSKIAVAFAFLTLEFRLIIQMFGFTRMFLHPDARPIGIPIIETVDEQAQHELDAALAGEEEKVVIAPKREN